MQIFQPVEKVDEFLTLDEGEIFCGYLDGLGGSECQLAQVSRSYWHGWRNGLVDGGFTKPDISQMRLAESFQTARR
ncbi:hypothetical protein DYI37_05420 [Fulvimarina endophytica]|uniref:Uncharacterized protein n=1 Tax=Fulvimarina endophytica TaxID=2293836 RepID=A0A371X7Q3_9HYPH|nr:hypothetical protein [Fulvimarina endophytica]RFC65279.1 hypothetical protein DYI37_05420 [Fulvimarina endophytica]